MKEVGFSLPYTSYALYFRVVMKTLNNRQSAFTIVELLIVIVVIAILAAITIVAYNGMQDKAKQAAMSTELAQWKKKSELYKIDKGIICPLNYAFVYGNTTLGTSDFCVMKYEATNVGGIATSVASGTPWINITQTSAMSTSMAACSGCHLITEAEWMTLAADVLTVKYNWTGGVVGSGYVYSGHSDSLPASALAASADDADGYNGTGDSSTSNNGQKRTHYLSSGDVMWDLAGNILEWTTGTLTGAQPGLSTDNVDGTTLATKQWTAAGLNWNSLVTSSRPSALASVAGLTNISTWSSSQGIGTLVSNQNQTATRAFLRGGAWNNTGSTGILTLNLIYTPSGGGPTVGFRVAR